MRPRPLLATLLLILPACASTPRADNPPPAPATLGPSHNAAPITASTLGDGPTRVYLIASIHGDEPEGRSALDHIHAALLQSTGHATVRLVNDMNPDGSAVRTRTNARGVDLNRNWPASNFKKSRANGSFPLSEPETAAVHADIIAFDPHFIVVLHSARTGPFVNYDGPAAAHALADRFASAARAAGDTRWRTVADMGYPTPGSMGSYFGKDRNIPVLTVELRRGDPLAHLPTPLVAGLNAVAAERSLALAPLSRAAPARRLAAGVPDAPALPAEQAR
jgi:protein MpaA